MGNSRVFSSPLSRAQRIDSWQITRSSFGQHRVPQSTSCGFFQIRFFLKKRNKYLPVSKVSRSIWCSPTTGVFFEKTGVLSSTFDHHLPHQISFQTPPIFSADLHIRAKELLQGTTATTGAFNHFTQSNLSVRWCCECVSCITLLQMSVGIFFLFGCHAIKRNKICSSGQTGVCCLQEKKVQGHTHTHSLTHVACHCVSV